MQTLFTQSSKGFHSLVVRLVRVALITTVLCLSLAVTAPSTAHADAVQLLSVCPSSDAALWITSYPDGGSTHNICFSGSGRLRLDGKLGWNTPISGGGGLYDYYPDITGWMRVYYSDGSGEQYLNMSNMDGIDGGGIGHTSGTFEVRELCIGCGWHAAL